MPTLHDTKFDRELTLADFAASFGTTPADVESLCGDLIHELDFGYRVIQGAERDEVLLTVLRKLETDTQVIGTEERTEVWEKGWSENLKDFRQSGSDIQSLTPKFIRPGQPIRFAGEYIAPRANNFELDYFSVLRQWLFKKYLAAPQNVYEFGCGTGFNLLALSKLYPEKRLYGSDFVASSPDLVNEIAKAYGVKLEGRVFNMRRPDYEYRIAPHSAAIHFGAVEQLASDIEPFLEYLLANTPDICIALEPTVELYDESILFDYVAARFHRKRGYTAGYLPRLQELEKSGKVKILHVQRTRFGSLFMEGFSYVIWKPL